MRWTDMTITVKILKLRTLKKKNPSLKNIALIKNISCYTGQVAPLHPNTQKLTLKGKFFLCVLKFSLLTLSNLGTAPEDC